MSVSAEDEKKFAEEMKTMAGQEFSFSVPLHVSKLDKTAEVGKLMATAGRYIGNQITTGVMQSRGEWDIDITVSMRKTGS